MKKFFAIILATLLLCGAVPIAANAAVSSEVTLNFNGAFGGTTKVTAVYGSAMPTPIALPFIPSSKLHVNYFNGYFDAKSGGTQYYTHQGVSARTWDKTERKVTLYAQWVSGLRIKNAVTYTVMVTGGIGSAECEAGETVTILATVPDGKVFVNWTASGVTLAKPSDARTTFKMPAKNVTVTANFAYKNPKGIFGTNARWYGAWWHYVLFFLSGFLWMWF